MVRFRVGERWRQEARGSTEAGDVRDSVALEIEGIDLLAGANDERLLDVVPALLQAVAGVARGEPAGQAALAGKGLELCFFSRPHGQVELGVVALADGPRLVRPAVTLELVELAHSLAEGAAKFQRVAERAGELPRSVLEVVSHTSAQLAALEGTQDIEAPGGFSFHAQAPGGATILLLDGEGRLASYRRHGPSLACLLVGGELVMGGARHPRPLLSVLQLTRARDGEPQAELAPLYRLGLELHVGLTQQYPALAGNPWLELLQVRCRDGLAGLREPAPPAPPPPPISAPRPRNEPALAAPGALRRLTFQTAWEANAEIDEATGLVLTRRGVVALGRYTAQAFDRRGRVQHRVVGAGGVAVAESGDVLLSTGPRLFFQRAHGKGAVWFRQGDALAPAGRMYEASETLVVHSHQRAVVALARATGRELWRLDPPRTSRSALAVHQGVALLSTEGGSLFAVAVDSGALLFRIRAALPFVGPAVPVRGGVLGVLGRGSEALVFFAESAPKVEGAAPGTVRWSRELSLERASQPWWQRGRVYVAGLRDGQGSLVALGAKGKVLWQRHVPLAGRRFSLCGAGSDVVVADERGGAALVTVEGELSWVVGGHDGPEPTRALTPVTRRGVVLVPGPVVRAIDAASGRELAALALQHPLADWAVDAKLGLTLLEENGRLRVLSHQGALSVVGAREP